MKPTGAKKKDKTKVEMKGKQGTAIKNQTEKAIKN
jgi:hypothetical protein